MRKLIEASQMIRRYDKERACLTGRRMSAQYKLAVARVLLSSGYSHPIEWTFNAHNVIVSTL